MDVRTMFVGIGATAAAAGGAAAIWLTLASQGGVAEMGTGAETEQTQRPPRTDDDVVVVCVAADSVVHAPRSEGNCAPGQREVSLELEETCEQCPPFNEPPPSENRDNAELNALDRRIRALENAPYFEVVDDRERPMFRVGPDGVSVFNESGSIVSAFRVTEYGGHFTASSPSGAREASLGAMGTTSGLLVTEAGMVRASLLAKEDTNSASLRFPSANGLIAGIGTSRDNTGALLVGDLAGGLKASLTVPGGRGMIRVQKDEKGSGVSLLEQSSGGGLFEIDNSLGMSAIKMGGVNNRYGLVVAGPTLGLPLIPKSALPGSYFMGCGSQAPPACMPNIP